MINWLQTWYRDQCDGDWEHENGIVIETLDNPGWSVTIDLIGTRLEGLEMPYVLNEVSDKVWLGYAVSMNKFKGASGPEGLNDIISIFRNLLNSK